MEIKENKKNIKTSIKTYCSRQIKDLKIKYKQKEREIVNNLNENMVVEIEERAELEYDAHTLLETASRKTEEEMINFERKIIFEKDKWTAEHSQSIKEECQLQAYKFYIGSKKRPAPV